MFYAINAELYKALTFNFWPCFSLNRVFLKFAEFYENITQYMTKIHQMWITFLADRMNCVFILLLKNKRDEVAIF